MSAWSMHAYTQLEVEENMQRIMIATCDRLLLVENKGREITLRKRIHIDAFA